MHIMDNNISQEEYIKQLEQRIALLQSYNAADAAMIYALAVQVGAFNHWFHLSYLQELGAYKPNMVYEANEDGTAIRVVIQESLADAKARANTTVTSAPQNDNPPDNTTETSGSDTQPSAN